jgi:hypothetical protein
MVCCRIEFSINWLMIMRFSTQNVALLIIICNKQCKMAVSSTLVVCQVVV